MQKIVLGKMLIKRTKILLGKYQHYFTLLEFYLESTKKYLKNFKSKQIKSKIYKNMVRYSALALYDVRIILR